MCQENEVSRCSIFRESKKRYLYISMHVHRDHKEWGSWPMLKKYLEQRHIDLDSGRSCLALEREYWQALEVLAYEDGLNNWRDFFYMRVLPEKPEDRSLASHVRKIVTIFQFSKYDERKSKIV